MHDEVGFFAEPVHWVVLSFFLFFKNFGQKLWGALAGMLDARAASVRAEIDEAARLKSEAERPMLEGGRSHAAARAQADARTLIAGAAAEAARVAETTRADAEAAAKRREQMALDRIAAAQKQAVDEQTIRRRGDDDRGLEDRGTER